MPSQSLTAVFIFSFAVSLGAVLSPGPVSVAIVSEGPRQGWKVGPLVALGHSALEAVFVILIAYGLSSGLASSNVQRLIALLGGILLLWIGAGYLYGVWRRSIRLPDPEHTGPTKHPLSLVSLGLVTTLSNPFWYAWWVTVAAGYLAQVQTFGIWGALTFYVGHISADFLWDSVLAGAVSWGGRWLTDQRYQALVLLAGGFMMVLGVQFIGIGLKM